MGGTGWAQNQKISVNTKRGRARWNVGLWRVFKVIGLWMSTRAAVASGSPSDRLVQSLQKEKEREREEGKREREERKRGFHLLSLLFFLFSSPSFFRCA
jgi:hypothetical protein